MKSDTLSSQCFDGFHKTDEKMEEYYFFNFLRLEWARLWDNFAVAGTFVLRDVRSGGTRELILEFKSFNAIIVVYGIFTVHTKSL